MLNTYIKGAGGLFSSVDSYTSQVHPYSNQREMVYISAEKFIGRIHEVYMRVLAHEFMHAVHENLDDTEEAWVNEGLAEFAVDVTGFAAIDDRHARFLRNPGVQLNYMNYLSDNTGAHYEAAHRFFVYLNSHFGGTDGIAALLRERADGTAGVDAFLEPRGTDFKRVFKDWVIANYVNDDEGPYGYSGEESGRAATRDAPGETEWALDGNQFSAMYLDVRPFVEDFTVEFEGVGSTPIFDGECHSGDRCWWSNMGDSIDTTLTREFDLSGVSGATLEYMAWYDIEEGWDYAYLETSRDGGRTWVILRPERASDADTLGNAYGPGYTGRSKGWVAESVDISDYAGGRVLVRFEYVTDGAIHNDGLALDDIAVPEIAFFDDAESDVGWDAAGFARIVNALPQEFFVQVILGLGDEEFEVLDVPLDENLRGAASIRGLGTRYESTILVVSPVTVGTNRPASYKVTVTAASR